MIRLPGGAAAADHPDALAAAVAAVLPEFGLDASSELTLLHRSENVTFEVTSPDGGRCVARVHRPGYSSADELRSEHEWVRFLARVGIPVAEPRVASDGRTHVPARLDDGSVRHVGVIAWVDGEPSSTALRGADAVTVREHYAALGSLMARLHRSNDRWEPPASFARRSWDVDGLLGERPHWGRFWELAHLTPDERVVLGAARRELRVRLADFGAGPDRFGLIHADLHVENVMATDGGLVVIDFDDAGYGWYLHDLAVALHHSGLGLHLAGRGTGAEGEVADIVGAMVAGYRAVRDLPDEHLARLGEFVVVRGLMNVGWAAARPEIVDDDGLAGVTALAVDLAHGLLEGRIAC